MNRKQKKILMFFIYFYLVAFFLFNWDDASWLFNYKTMSGLLYDFFTPYKSTGIYSVAPVFSNYPKNNNINANEQVKFTYSGKNNILEIPAIGISAPIIFSETTDKKVLAKDLNKGVIVYPGSVLPGENGLTVVLGHSSPPNWPKARYDWVFNDLNNLNLGDKIFFTLNNKKYTYQVIKKEIIEKGQEITSDGLTNYDNVIILVSCWPPGKDLKRIVIYAELNFKN